MSLPKFLSMLHQRSLCFVKPSLFEDKFEWTFPNSWLEAYQVGLQKVEAEYEEVKRKLEERQNKIIEAEPWAHQWESLPPDQQPSVAERQRIRNGNIQDIKRATGRYATGPAYQKYRMMKAREEEKLGELQRKIDLGSLEKEAGFVNCWFKSEHESIAMWDLYSSREGGVSIQSTIERLMQSLASDPTPVHIAQVEYLDFESDTRPIWNHVSTYKRVTFKHEDELRAVILDGEVNRNLLTVTDFGAGVAC